MRQEKQRGFTLVELMIVVMVIGVLAAVAIPLYQVVPQRSRSTEAVAGLGLVREAMRTFYAEHGSYAHPSFVDGELVTVGGVLCVDESDLDGRYFSAECYTFDGDVTDDAYTIECDAAASTAPHASDASGIVVIIDHQGEITSTWN